MPTFFLAGLESQGLEKLYPALAENEIDALIDIRLTGSPGLREELRRLNELHGRHIAYHWLKVFGNPFFDRDDPVEAYRGYLVGMDRELEELYVLIMRHRCCVVDAAECPERSCRRALAEALKKKYGIVFADLSAADELIRKYGCGR